MSNGGVSDVPDETIGMIRARRWSYVGFVALAGAVSLLDDWRMALALLALAWVIHLEAARVRQAVWPECYHAVRKAVDDQQS